MNALEFYGEVADRLRRGDGTCPESPLEVGQRRSSTSGLSLQKIILPPSSEDSSALPTRSGIGATSFSKNNIDTLPARTADFLGR